MVKTIRLKFPPGKRPESWPRAPETHVILARDEREAAKKIQQLVSESGAIGFSTESTVESI